MDSIDEGAVVIGRVGIKDSARWAVYRDGVPATLQPFGGTIVARGGEARTLAGTLDEADMVILHFPSVDAADRWYRSDAYQALITLRDAAAEVTIVRYRVAS
jgi:uncharacterized protein (DUF1330 family)